MKSKKDKNVSVQISLSSIFDQISKLQHIDHYRDYPHQLADQIDDLKTLLHFAATNYTNKARTILNLTKQFTKSNQSTLEGVNNLDVDLYQMPQPSYPELAYEALKRSTNLDLEEENQQLDWRAVHTEYQLKFMESKNIADILKWQKCYNIQQRCIQIGKFSSQMGSYNSRQSLMRPLQIDLTLKVQNSQIVWHVKKILYHNNLHYGLLGYLQNDLMQWIREQHNNNLEQSQKHVLSLLYKSLDYVDIILLFIELRSMSFNQNIEQTDRKNGILNLFDEKDTQKFSYLKGKNIKVCFLLPYSNFQPSMILRVDGLNVLKLEFNEKNEIHFKIKLKHKSQELTLKKLLGSIKKKKLSLSSLLQIVHKVLESLQTYEKFIVERADKFKMDIFITNRTTNLLIYLSMIGCTLLEENIAQSEAVNSKVKYDLSINNISSSGLYFVFTSLVHSYLPPLISFVSPSPQLLLKTVGTEFGFVNKMLKNHPTITFEEAMYHIHFLQQIEHHQLKSNWNVKLVYADIYITSRDMKEEFISYKFKQVSQKKVSGQSSIVKREIKPDHANTVRDYSLHVKIHENFKSVLFVFVTPNEISRSDHSLGSNSQTNIGRNMVRPHQNQIPDKYFKSTWREYLKKRSESQILKNQYLDIDQLLKATHYILNHLEFNRYIKGKTGIFKNEEMVQLMDQ